MKNSINSILAINNLSETILDALPNFIYITDKDGDVIYINKAGLVELSKLKLESLKNASEFFYKREVCSEHEEKLNVKYYPLYKTLKDKEEVTNLVLKFDVDDETLYFSVSSFPLIKDNISVGALITVLDITEDYLQRLKIKNEREKFLELSTELKTKCDIIEILRNREKEHLMHLKDVINNISEGIMVVETNERISLCNKAVFNILDLTAIELVNPKKFIDKYDVTIIDHEEQNLKNIYVSYIKGKKPINNAVVKLKERKSLEIKYIEVNSAPIINKNDELVYTILTIKDITEAKLHQINAEEQADFVRDVVNTVDVPIAVVDYPSIKYRLVNAKYEEIMGYNIYKSINSEGSLDDSHKKVRYINHDLHNILVSVGEKYNPYTISPYKVKDHKGDDRFYKIKFVPCKNKDNSTRIHIHGSDVTEEINHNIELEKITQLKDEFFTIISHELRTPLTIMYSSLQLAYDVYNKEITPNIDKTLARISQNCSRLLKLINNVLDISKAEAGFLATNSSDFDLVYVSETIVNLANSYATSKGIELIFDTNEEECNVRLDKDKYEKILLNLLSNAVKFTPEGQKVMVCLNIEEDHFYLSVKDFGVGIPKDKINSIFDRFAQINSSLSRRAEGTGIGLALVKKFIELMNGEIKVISETGKGTEFIVKFKKENVEVNHINNYAILTENIDERINTEFSDIN